jgi:hypothetical protein
MSGIGTCETCGALFGLSGRGRVKRFCSPPCRASSKKVRADWLRSAYGITPEQFDVMLLIQGGRCAVCGTDAPGGKHDRFMVDHCHSTGAVRGLLCNACNHGIGLLGDSADGVRKALEYLNKARGA